MSLPSVVSVFSGIGGLDAGLERSGFEVVCGIEKSPIAQAALRKLFPHWPLSSIGDVHEVTGAKVLAQIGLKRGDLSLLSAGPPCQPYSKASAWVRPASRSRDPRASTIPALFRLAADLVPRAILIENVPELVSQSRGHDTLRKSFDRLNGRTGANYHPTIFDIECSEFGVPQRRRRVFILADREGRTLLAPSVTHGDGSGMLPRLSSWDAIGHLDTEIWSDELRPTGYWADLLSTIPEGENYLHHTARGGGMSLFGWRTKYWSFLLKLAKSRPSWTISATPGPATGPFHWRSRRLSFRELAALQTFPAPRDPGLSLRESQRLMGNAVPSAIGELFGRLIRRDVLGIKSPSGPLTLLPEHRNDCPGAEKATKVAAKYECHAGEHIDHPGVGKGPGAGRRLKNAMVHARRRAA